MYLTEFQRQCSGLGRLCLREHLDADGHCGTRIGREEGQEVAGGLAGAGVEGREGGCYGGYVFGDHFGGA